MKLLDEYPDGYSYDLNIIINKIISEEELTLDREQPYIFGGLFATYMYDRIKNNKNNIMELFELNEMLKYYSFDQVLDYLDLNYNNVELTDDSYQKLEEKYKKYLKNR